MPIALGAAEPPRLQGVKPPGALRFETDVLPILESRCTECHGISKQSSGLRVDSIDALLRGGKKGPALVAGKSDESRLFELITAEGKKRMPPKGDRVSVEEVETIRRWIDAGARAGGLVATREVSIKIEKLPADFQPVLAVAGEHKTARLAVGRGPNVVITTVEGADAGKPIAALEGEGDLVQSLAFSPDGKLLAVGGFRDVVLWATASWKPKMRLGPHADRVLALDFSPDGGLLAVAGGIPSRTGEVKIWQPGTGKLMRTLSDVHTDSVYAVRFSPDGVRLATGAGDRMVHLFELASGARVGRFEGHTHHVMGLAFRADGQRLISAGAESKIKSWDLEKGSGAKDWKGHGKAVNALASSPDGKIFATASGDRTVRLWNPDGGQVKSFGDAAGQIYALAIFGEGRYLAAAGADRAVRVYSLKEQKLLHTIAP